MATPTTSNAVLELQVLLPFLRRKERREIKYEGLLQKPLSLVVPRAQDTLSKNFPARRPLRVWVPLLSLIPTKATEFLKIFSLADGKCAFPLIVNAQKTTLVVVSKMVVGMILLWVLEELPFLASAAIE